MKKIIHKLKKSRLVSKIAALLTICMILVSSFTVSSFAADEDDVSTPTDSITDVWTSVMNWITTSLGSVQGVFYSSGGSSFTLYSSDIFTLDNEEYFVPLVGFDPVGAVNGEVYVFEFMGVSHSLTFASIESESAFTDDSFDFFVWYIPSLVEGMPDQMTADTWYLVMTEPFSGTATLVTPFGGSPQLTFLGVLAVIGVAIAIAFFIISIISRFLRLRG